MTRRRHRILQHRCWSLARRYTSTIFVHTLPRQRTRNGNKSNKRKWFLPFKKARSRQFPTDANYADDQALHVNTPTQAEFLLHSLEQAAGGIGTQMNANRTEFMFPTKSSHLQSK